MEKSLIFFCVLFIIFLILSIFLKASLVKFNDTFVSDISQNEKKVNELFKFSYDIHFNSAPDNIDITNPYECTATNLKKCDINNPFSCVGCKSLISRCINFVKDTKYIDSNGVETIIPKNDSNHEGYCLTQINPSQACNPYHGDLVLVQTDPDSIESMLYCECKNPGYIGKTHIDGACDEAFICDGKVEDINKPLNEINCVCNDELIPEIINNTPSCIYPSVKNYKHYDDDNFYENIDTVPKDRFIPEISNIAKFPGANIINPCKYCLLTGKFVTNGDMVETDDDGWQCVLRNSRHRGLPVRRDPGYRVLKGKHGPDGIIDISVEQVYIHGYMYDSTFEQMSALINVNENKEILEFIGITDFSKTMAYIDLRGHELVFPRSFGSMYMNQFAGIACTGVQVWGWADDFSYQCYFVNKIPSDRNPKGHHSYMFAYQFDPLIAFETAPECPPKKHSIMTGGAFGKWKEYEGQNSAHYGTLVNNILKLEMHEKFKQSSSIRFIFSIYNLKDQTSRHLAADHTNTYDKWYATQIPK
ncbi:PIF-1 [Carcinus maenas nudivirus]|uniref:PIF-1 n=1 Tax=Carcinus maenas nudivirus TaxID=2880837 RepID=A0AAE9BZ52_9VIRU|nr:PIF-1 [Carcinus maenas nudivirus]UBZ25617.1 PIF-1 [Carcinus maenas nudivirus]